MTNILKKSLIVFSKQHSIISKKWCQSSRAQTTIAKKYILSKYFTGEPNPTSITLVEEKLPAIKDGEILVQAEYLSVDPYMRVYSLNLPIGKTMIGSQVAKIIESKNPKFPVGKSIVGYMGWRTHTILNQNILESHDIPMTEKPYLIPDFGDLSSSLALGVLGMTGNTAYFGLLDICKPKAGETVVISGAGGAVGSHVGQIAKIHGLKTIGLAGTDSKCNWLVDELGFDYAINYKTRNVAAMLKEVAPDGIDCYFDNVGGDISTKIIYQMKLFGRIAVCGSISSYNANSLPKTSILQPAIVPQQLKMEGFIVSRWNDRWMEGIEKNLTWIREGKLRYRETITDGFENIFQAFCGMLKGENFGKSVVKV